MKLACLNILLVCLVISNNGLAQKGSIKFYELVHLNDSSDDFSPVFLDSNTMLFTSSRKNAGSEKITAHSHSIFQASLVDQEWSEPKRLTYLTNSDNHEASVGLSKDSKTLYVYKTFNGGDIYSSLHEEAQTWAPLHKMKINSPFHESSACECDGILYFVSDKPGGKGKHDIYFSEMKKGKWSKGTNLGSLNSDKDENHLYLTKDCKTMYFSSKGHSSNGGYDVFRSSKNTTGGWPKPINVGGHINSVHNEINYTQDINSFSYFASDRPSKKNKGYNLYSNMPLKNNPIDSIAIIGSLLSINEEKDYSTLENLTLDEVKATIDFEIDQCRVQVGAFSRISTLEEFHKSFPLLTGKVDMLVEKNFNRFLLKESITTLDEAVEIQKKCILKYNSVKDTFIGVYDKTGMRVLIYFNYSDRYQIRHTLKKM